MKRATLILAAVLMFAVLLTGCGGGGEDGGESGRRQPAVDPPRPDDTMPPDPADETTFSDLVEGQSMMLTPAEEGNPFCVRFTGEWRFESWDPGTTGFSAGWYAGDYADLTDGNEPGTLGTLSFTWDPDNDPDEAELIADLTFTSKTQGTYEYVYSEGEQEDYPAVQGHFEIIEGLLDGADCQSMDPDDTMPITSLSDLTSGPVPVIDDPPAYVSDMVTSVIEELEALATGDWQVEIDALLAAEKELLESSPEEVLDLAIFLKQNVEPILLQIASPVVAQDDPKKRACDRAMKGLVASVITSAASVPYLGALVRGVSSLIRGLWSFCVSILAFVNVIGASTASNAIAVASVWDNCVRTEALAEELGNTAQNSPLVASDGGRTITFDEGQATGIRIAVTHRLEDSVVPEFRRATRDLNDALLSMRDDLEFLIDGYGHLLPGFVENAIDASIAKIDGSVSDFAAFDVLERVETPNQAGFRLGGISDPNITGSITSATSERLFLAFSFRDPSRVPAEGHVDFEFALSNGRAGLEAVNVPARLVANEVTVEILSATCTYLRPLIEGYESPWHIYKAVITGRATGPVGATIDAGLNFFHPVPEMADSSCYASDWTERRIVPRYIDGLQEHPALCVRGPTDPPFTTFTIPDYTSQRGVVGVTAHVHETFEHVGVYAGRVTDSYEVVCE